jgi:hypothetical protein
LAAEVHFEPLAAALLPFQGATSTVFLTLRNGDFPLKYTPALNHFRESGLSRRQGDL